MEEGDLEEKWYMGLPEPTAEELNNEYDIEVDELEEEQADVEIPKSEFTNQNFKRWMMVNKAKFRHPFYALKYYIRTVRNLVKSDLPGFESFYNANKDFFQNEERGFCFYTCSFVLGIDDFVKHENLVREKQAEEDDEARKIKSFSLVYRKPKPSK